MMDFYMTFKIWFSPFWDICSAGFGNCTHVMLIRNSKNGHTGNAMLSPNCLQQMLILHT